jgi:multidrug efflux pump subunit AcrB
MNTGAQWTLRGDTYEGLEWHDEVIPKPTEAEINEAIANIPNVEEANLKAWQDKDMAKQSALAKLAKLGLTEDEIKAIVS